MRRTQLITSVALVAACAAPASAVAQTQDLRSPDARDAASAAEKRSYQDLRSPDARDAARPVETPSYTDLRSPDARDAARAVETPSYTDLRSPDARDAGLDRPPVTIPVVDVPGNTGGFDWSDAGIGAAGMLGLMGIAAGSILAVLQSRRRRRHALAQ
jgi:hypothetical protein